MAFSDTMDSATLETVLRLLHSDTEEVTSKFKGKQKQGEVTDAEYAFSVFKQDLISASMIVQSRILAESIDTAVRQDGDIIQTSTNHDHQPHSNGQMTPPMVGRRSETAMVEFEDRNTETGGSATESVSPNGNNRSNLEEKSIQVPNSKSLVHFATPSSNEDQVEAESSARAAKRSRKNVNDQPKITCTACNDHFDSSEILCVPCQHNFCLECVATLFSRSTIDEQLFPPRCCKQEILLDHVRPYLDPDLIKTFEVKAIELGTQNRTYCFEPSCATFIPPDAINDGVATCPGCQRTTCSACKNVSHSGDCPVDQELQSLLTLAEAQQWQRCFSCQNMVELNIGCNHITCRCKAQFCYVCGKEWRTCECLHINEDRLYARAIQLVNRDPNHRLFQPPGLAHLNSSNEREGRIAQAVERIREHPECNRHSWTCKAGRHECEECGDLLFLYIFRCDACLYQICKWCKNHRL